MYSFHGLHRNIPSHGIKIIKREFPSPHIKSFQVNLYPVGVDLTDLLLFYVQLTSVKEAKT